MKYTTNRKINVRTIRKLTEEQGLTLKNGKIVEYKTGWQVATIGVECTTPEEVMRWIRHSTKTKKNVGVWLENGIYYVDFSQRITTKKEAVTLGMEKKQISIYSWYPRKEKLLYLGL